MNRNGQMIVKKAVAITPSDSVEIEPRPDAILVGGAGAVACMWEDTASSTLTGLLAGNVYPVSPRRILATGTTATNISALYFDVSVK